MSNNWTKAFWQVQCLLFGINEINKILLNLTEQIKPQHIVGEDSLDNEDGPRQGELRYVWFIAGASMCSKIKFVMVWNLNGVGIHFVTL